MPDHASILIERARALVPLLEEHAAEAERLRKPHDAVMAAIEEAEIFKLMVPRERGGFELDLDTFLEVGLTLSEGDASMAWVTTFLIEHCWLFCHFPPSTQDEIFGDKGYALAPGVIAPTGVAKRVEGGFRLDGRWQWGTGITHSTWVMVGARVESDNGELDIRFLTMPIEDVTVDDTWYVDGMRATGSNDIVIDDLFVPEARSANLMEIASGNGPASKFYSGPLYKTPMIPILALAAAMPAVGQARAAINRFREAMSGRIMYGTMDKQADRPAAQIRLARAELEVLGAELLLRDAVREVMELRENATPQDRARWVAMYALAVDQSKRVLQSIAEVSGAKAHFETHPLQRAVRDMNTLACHVVFDLDSRLELMGRAMLGHELKGLL